MEGAVKPLPSCPFNLLCCCMPSALCWQRAVTASQGTRVPLPAESEVPTTSHCAPLATPVLWVLGVQPGLCFSPWILTLLAGANCQGMAIPGVPALTPRCPVLLAGLILVNEPYYNEAGFDSDRGLQEGYENSRCYNEMTLIRVVQSMMQLLRRPVEVFEHEIREHFRCNGWRLVSRIESWLETNELVERSHEQANGADSASLLCGSLAESPGDTAGALAEGSSEQGAAAELSDSAPDGREEPDEPEFPTTTPNAGDLQQFSDSESTGQARGDLARDRTDEGKAAQDSASQPSVKPKKRRKSYRSFLPEKSGYPDIGFPLFPLSKGFIKSIRGVLQQYRAALAGANIPEWTEDK